MNIDYFPWGVAEGRAFFDRNEETDRLLSNIKSGRHTLLISPRRYGKSSLARYAVKIADMPYSEIDLFLIVDDKSIEYRILKGVRELIQKVSDTPSQSFNTLRNFFSKANKKWIIGVKGVMLELIPENHSDIADNIMDGLNALEYILTKKKQRAVLFLDEFQEITKSSMGSALEGAIRHFAQSSKYLSFIFSGSNRHMLLNMFGDRSKPLYQLCDRMVLSRIDQKYYFKYLNEIAKETWTQPIKEDVFAEIMQLTERHANYVYILCSLIWRKFPKKQPSADDVSMIWRKYIHELSKETRAELEQLNTAQLKVLIIVGLKVSNELTGKEVQRKLNLSSGGIVYALNVLENMDYIEKLDDNSYCIINPVIRETLEMFYKEIL